MMLVFVFMLAAFLGFELINRVPSQLHTPLMSGANAASGVTLVGAAAAWMVMDGWAAWMALIATALAMINVVGGYLVTDRMLGMFTAGQRRK